MVAQFESGGNPRHDRNPEETRKSQAHCVSADECLSTHSAEAESQKDQKYQEEKNAVVVVSDRNRADDIVGSWSGLSGFHGDRQPTPSGPSGFHETTTPPTSGFQSDLDASGLALLAPLIEVVQRGVHRTIERIGFEVARHLRQIPDVRPRQLESVVRRFCELAGLKNADVIDNVWWEFVTKWEDVQKPVGHDTWDQCLQCARHTRLVFDPDPGDSLATLAALAFYLSQENGDGRFTLPLSRIKKSFGYSEPTASRVREALTTLDVVGWARADGAYSFKNGHAREYVFKARLVVPPASDPAEKIHF